VKKIIAYGEAGPIVEKDLRDVVSVELLGSDFDEVMRHARESASPGDAVLMSPACSSYDMFRNYEERGERFRKIALGE
jgi:UDP-N-acetylmuramoylalanine--D-glutamate ligase